MNTLGLKLALAACMGACVTTTTPIVWDHIKPHPKHRHHTTIPYVKHEKVAALKCPDTFTEQALRPLPSDFITGSIPADSGQWITPVKPTHPAPEPATWTMLGIGWVLMNMGVAGAAMWRSRT